MYFCLQPSKSVRTTLNFRWIQDAEKGTLLMMEFYPEGEVEHSIALVFTEVNRIKFSSFVILLFLNHTMIKNRL